MPGPYTNITGMTGAQALTHLGGYAKVDDPANPITNPDEQVSAEETNKQIGGLVDLVNWVGTYQPQITSQAAAIAAIEAWIAVYQPQIVASANYIAVTAHGAVGDGVADDVAAIEAAWAAAKAAKKDLFFPPGTYRVSRAPYLASGTGITIFGVGATITFPSADAALVAGGNYTTSTQKRSAMFLHLCDKVTVRDLWFQGQDAETSFLINIGACVSILGSNETTLLRLDHYGGGCLISEPPNNDYTANKGTLVERCRSRRWRNSSVIGHNGTYRKVRFEQSTDAAYDNNDSLKTGSTHACYQPASGGQWVTWEDCYFENVRYHAIKVSGTAFQMHGVRILNNVFRNNYQAAVLFGADQPTDQDHDSCIIANNQAFDLRGPFCTILGGRSVKVTGNQVYWNSAPPSIMSSIIDVKRYGETSVPMENVLVMGNQLDAAPSITPTLIATSAILVQRVGTVTGRVGAVTICQNMVTGCAAYGIQTVRCIAPQIVGNTFNRLSFEWLCDGDRMPVWLDNTCLDSQLNFPQVKFTANVPSFPVIGRNRHAGKIGSYDGKPTTGDSGNVARDWPLLGLTGKAVATGSHPEALMAYGADWTDGDTFKISGVTVGTYKGTAPGAGEFNTPAGLIALINAYSGGAYTASDYGAAFTPAVTMNHIKVALTATSTTADLFWIETSCAKPTAGVVLPNSTAGSRNRCYSRGEGADKLVIWSPLAGQQEAPSFVALNAAARTAMGGGGPMQVYQGADEFACYVTEWGGLGGTEQWRWRIN